MDTRKVKLLCSCIEQGFELYLFDRYSALLPAKRVRCSSAFVFGAVCPHDGQLATLILPDANTEAMSLFLAEVSRRYAQEHILMFLDRAGWHCARRLQIPDNVTLDWLPPYSPECNPDELAWRELRRSSIGNREFGDLSAREDESERAPRGMESAPERIGSLTGFDRMINVR